MTPSLSFISLEYAKYIYMSQILGVRGSSLYSLSFYTLENDFWKVLTLFQMGRKELCF